MVVAIVEYGFVSRNQVWVDVCGNMPHSDAIFTRAIDRKTSTAADFKGECDTLKASDNSDIINNSEKF